MIENNGDRRVFQSSKGVPDKKGPIFNQRVFEGLHRYSLFMVEG